MALAESDATPLGRILPPRYSFGQEQLNTPAGQGTDALLLILRRSGLLTAPTDELSGSAWERLNQAVSEGWGGVEARYAIGRQLVALHQLDPTWLLPRLTALWPTGDDVPADNARRAFLHGYLAARQWERGLLELLVPVYRDVIPDAGVAEPRYLVTGPLVEALADDLVGGWLAEIPCFGPDGLIGDLAERGGGRARARVAWVLGRRFRDATAAGRRQLRPILSDYWGRRVAALANLGTDEQHGELTHLTEWASLLGLSLRTVGSRLEFALGRLAYGAGLDAILACLANRAEREPDRGSRILRRLVERYADVPSPRWRTARMREALSALGRAAAPADQRTLTLVVDRLLRANRGDYRDVLPGGRANT